MKQVIVILLLPSLLTVSREYEYKMVIVVNDQAKLSIGKTAAQVAHGAVSLFMKLSTKESCRTDLQHWLQQGQTKVVLKGMHPDHLMQLKEKAKKLRLHSCIIRDAGFTEVKEGTLTVLALFGLERTLNKVTSNLPLLK